MDREEKGRQILLTDSWMKTEEAQRFHLGSESGKIWPISGRPSAPRIASTMQ